MQRGFCVHWLAHSHWKNFFVFCFEYLRYLRYQCLRRLSLLLQSLHQAAFLMSVCHIILVVQDWFTDINLIRFVVRYHRSHKQILRCIKSVLMIDSFNVILFVTVHHICLPRVYNQLLIEKPLASEDDGSHITYMYHCLSVAKVFHFKYGKRKS